MGGLRYISFIQSVNINRDGRVLVLIFEMEILDPSQLGIVMGDLTFNTFTEKEGRNRVDLGAAVIKSDRLGDGDHL